MVPLEGSKSNLELDILSVIQDSKNSDSSSDPLDDFFNTLAQWNDYLEKDVPYFSEDRDVDIPEPEPFEP